jgi:hypothetical protein
MAREYYIQDDFTYGIAMPIGDCGDESSWSKFTSNVNHEFLNDPERMRIRFQKTLERWREIDKKEKKKLQRAQKYTKL